MSRCTCQGVPNPECNYDHASENERIEALRYELASLPKFVAESLQCIDADVVAALFVAFLESTKGVAARANFGNSMAERIAVAVGEYRNYCVNNWSETRLCDTGDEAAILRTLIARYR